MANTGLLNQVATQLIEPQVKPFTLFIGGWLPQHWVFNTESGSSTLVVEKTGDSRGLLGASPTPDVTVNWTDAQLDAAFTVALTNGDRNTVPRNPPPRIETHTKKGRDALSMLGKRLGLA
jgi:hypothetical protein